MNGPCKADRKKALSAKSWQSLEEMSEPQRLRKNYLAGATYVGAGAEVEYSDLLLHDARPNARAAEAMAISFAVFIIVCGLG